MLFLLDFLLQLTKKDMLKTFLQLIVVFQKLLGKPLADSVSLNFIFKDNLY